MSKEIQEWKQATHFQHSVHSVGRSYGDGRENLVPDLYQWYKPCKGFWERQLQGSTLWCAGVKESHLRMGAYRESAGYIPLFLERLPIGFPKNKVHVRFRKFFFW